MFEQLKSYANLKQHIYDIDDLKSKLCATHYTNFKDFRKNVLEIATREINQYTDLEVSWEPITQGRKVVQIKFYISERDKNWGNFRLKNKKQIDGQMDMYDFISGEEVKYTDQLITITKG